jgi:hypothetical protein
VSTGWLQQEALMIFGLQALAKEFK